MKYHSYTRFERVQPTDIMVQPGGAGTPIDPRPITIKVPANGASCIEFLALPLACIGQGGPPNGFGSPVGPGFEWEKQSFGISQILSIAAQVNGIPLLPTVLDAIKPSEIRAGRPFYNRAASGERLKFKHLPNVQDQTIYEILFPDPTGGEIGGSPAVMVIRTFTTLVR